MPAPDDAPTPAFADIGQQLEAAGREVRDTGEAYQNALRKRDDLVVDASDQGMPTRAIANRLQISQQRVARLTLPRADQ